MQTTRCGIEIRAHEPGRICFSRLHLIYRVIRQPAVGEYRGRIFRIKQIIDAHKKFGIDIERTKKVFEDFADNGSVDLCAIHVHLGSGGKTIDPYCKALEKILPLIDDLRAKGYRIETLDLGGGYGADYESDTAPAAADYASGIIPLLQDKDLKIILEPGKSIAANAGILVPYDSGIPL